MSYLKSDVVLSHWKFLCESKGMPSIPDYYEWDAARHIVKSTLGAHGRFYLLMPLNKRNLSFRL